HRRRGRAVAGTAGPGGRGAHRISHRRRAPRVLRLLLPLPRSRRRDSVKAVPRAMGRGRDEEPAPKQQPAPEPEGTRLRGADAAVWAEGLTYRYGTFVAVRGIDLAVRRGECFGLLGPNGAGKTTTIRMITCRVPPSDGVLVVAGLDVRRFRSDVKARLGVENQQDNLDEAISVQENLE